MATYTETFTAADSSTSMNADLTWTHPESSVFGITSNRGYAVSSGGGISNGPMRALAQVAANLDGSDHYVEVTTNAGGGAFGSRAKWAVCRGNSTDLECYFAGYDNTQNVYIYHLNSLGTSATQLATASFSHTIGTEQTIKFEVSGTTLNLYMNGAGSPTLSTTDSTITTGVRAGIGDGVSIGTGRYFDNFTAEDLAAGGGGNPWYYYNQQG